MKPMVYCGLYPIDSTKFDELRESLDKLKLNDASLFYEAETSKALGFGFRCGFLGLLHMEITLERIEREFKIHFDCNGSIRYLSCYTDDWRDH